VDALAYDKLARLLSSTAKNASNQTIYSEAMTTYFPNGNPNAVADSVNGTWTYNYDTLNRLTTAVSSTTGQGCQFGYDAFGNRTQEASYEGSCYTQNFTFTGTTTNRVDGYCYDAAGNLLDAGPCSTPPVPNQNLYDGFGNMISGNEMNADPTTYTVDALGNRVAKSQNGIIQRQYLYSIDGNPVAEMDGSGGLQQTDVRAGGQFLAEYRTAGLYYLHKDHLGTIRAESTPAGTIAVTCTSLPFGDGQTCTGTADPSGYFFTGKERDSESGNDYFGARYYASSMGRFMSPDPGWFMEADPTNPQTWNLYSYALNNPLKLIDPTGMDQCIWDDGTSDDRPEDGGATQQECADQGGNWASDTDTTITVTPQSTDPKPSCSDFTGPAAPPAGPINYRQQAQSNSQKSLPGLFQAFKTGGSQDFKGNPAFGNRTNQINAGNFNFGATMAAMGKTLNGAAFWAGVGAELSNAQTQVSWAAGQVAATPPVPYPVNTGIAPSPAPASTVGPGSPGSPTYAPNTGLMNQGDQDATNENQAVALGFVWYSMGCTQ
jgi:RHS repeat-associated protein